VAPCKFGPMRRTATYLFIICLLSGAAYGDSGRVEQITLDISDSLAVAEVKDGRIYSLSSATTSIEIEGRWLGIYRWILSARDTSRVSARLIDERWEPVEGTALSLPPQPLLRVHSPQVWGQIRVVLLDLYPWRISNGRLEVLKGGRLEVTIRHWLDDPVVEPTGPLFQTPGIANQVVVKAERPVRPLLRRPTAAIPEGGSWLKIPILKAGLYHLTAAYLSGAGLPPEALDLSTLRLFAPASLGRPMPDSVGVPLRDTLVELAIHVRDGGDGDDILFYAQGPWGFDLTAGDLTFVQNPYTDEACVWLHIPEAAGGADGKKMTPGPAFALSDNVITTGRTLYHHEVEVFNGFHSGPVWHQAAIKKGKPFTLSLPTPHLRSGEPAYLRVQLRGGSGDIHDYHTHRVTLSLRGEYILTSPGGWGNNNNVLLAPSPDLITSYIQAGQNNITLDNISPQLDPTEEVWLDWVEIDYGLDLAADEDALAFLIRPRAEQANLRLAGFPARPVVVDITDPASPIIFLRDQQVRQEDDHWLFTPQDLATARRYLALTEDKLQTPGSPVYYPDLDFTTLRNQDHKADYIVITAGTLLPAARELAGIHAREVRPELQRDTLVTTVDEIYEEFSGGVADPFAIRAFLRWGYENWLPPDRPVLVVLFGDGDYDYRNISGNSRILVPTIQVDGSDETHSRTIDDAFVYLDSIPVSTPLPDMGIGRIAVSTLEDAEVAVEMVRTYMVNPEPGAWRQRVLLAADDPVRPNDNERGFIEWSDRYAGMLPPSLQVEKIYLTEYAEVRDPATNTVVKPAAAADLIRSVNQGVALINYVGHGSATQWAQEQLLMMDRDRVLLQPGNRIPVWFAGTCAWGRFDQLEAPSMSEVLTASSEYAAIAVVSAVRGISAYGNFMFIGDLFSKTFPSREPSLARIGEILRKTKVGGETDRFHLFGDPAILIAFPREPLTLNAVTPDPLKVLGTAGYTGTTAGGAVTTGECLVTVLDAPREVTREYRSLDGSIRDISYALPGAPIFRGSVTVEEDGSFSGYFVIPKDISYSDSAATIIAYAWSDNKEGLIEQIGYRDDLFIRGTDPAAILDSTGPLITPKWEDRPLVSGDALPEGAQVEVELKDPRGINLTGEVGHAIRVWVDDESSAEGMDPLFQYDCDSHTTGGFPYQFDPVLSGRHEFSVEAWDGANNKAVLTVTLHLTLDEGLDVSDLFNFPNPFSDATEFVYTLYPPADVTITIYTINGVKVRVLEAFAGQAGFQRLPWDGRDKFGDQIANGAYLYHFRAELDGQTITRWGRLACLR